MNNNQEKLKNKMKETTETVKEKTDQVRHSSAWQKTKEMAKNATNIAGSHLAATRASITLSNEEAELMGNLKDKLNKKGIYPSKSEILRAGLWSLKSKNEEELEKAVEDLFKIKQRRIL